MRKRARRNRMTTSTIGVDHERTGRASYGPRAVLRLLPLAVVGALVALVALLALGPMAAPAQAVGYSAEEVAFVKLINDYRVSNGLQPLLVSDALSESGDRHSSDMGKYRFFDHYTQASDWFAKGASPWDRMAASGYTYNTWKGENIAAGLRHGCPGVRRLEELLRPQRQHAESRLQGSSAFRS